ncbi:signal peptidase I [Flavobacterium sp. GCM10027622]|uniref:signal peptidase I n=1 Tax=unclassified Flavobacterium TaxID=196869 RepID=UPI003617BBA1
MNPIVKKVLIVAGVIFTLYSITSFFGIFKMYNNSTMANEPNLKIGSKFFVSNLVTPKNGDFIAYSHEDPYLGKHSRIHRLCGMENDTIEIKNGVLYLNGINTDTAYTLLHLYQTTVRDYEKIRQEENIPDENRVESIGFNTMNATLADAVAQKYGIADRIIEPKGKVDKTIASVFKQNWNKDNFGPLKIPQGKLFVLGDNRDNSEDSRYIGCIDASNILGVVIAK